MHNVSGEPSVSQSFRSLGRGVATLGSIKLIVNTAFRFVYPFLPVISRGLGINLNQAGVLVSVRWAAGLVIPSLLSISRPVTRSRRFLGAGVLLFGIGSIVTAWTGVYVGAVIGFILLGLAKPLVDISASNYVAARVRYEDRARYIGFLELAWAGGLLIGGPFAAWLIDNWSWKAPFWVLASLGFLGLGVALVTIESHDRVGKAPAESDNGSPIAQIVPFLAAIALIGFAHESVFVVLGSWLENSFGLTLLALGGIGTMLGIAELVGESSMVSFTDRIGKRNSMAIGIGLGGLALLGLSLVSEVFVPSMIALFIATTAVEFGYISGIPIATELRPHHRARVLGWFFMATGVGRIAGDIVAPRVFETGGTSAAYLMAALAILASVAILLLFVREIRSEVAT
jgi:predicted MFS family arabinose efflux permease